MASGKIGNSRQGGFRQDRRLQARLATPDEIVCMAVARGRQSRLRMREEEDEIMKVKRNRQRQRGESFKGVRGERREGRVN